MTTSEQINELAAALAKAQGEMEGAKKDAKNPFFSSKYADLASVWDACREPLSTNGLAVVQFPKTEYLTTPEPYEWQAKSGEKRYGVRVVTVVSVLTRLVHCSGQFMEDACSTMLPTGDPQAVGSAITYLRRYALQSVAGIAPEDDDGNGAQGDRGEDRRPPSAHKTPAPAGPLVPQIPATGSMALKDPTALANECLRLSNGDKTKAAALFTRATMGVTTPKGMPPAEVPEAWARLSSALEEL
jgi:hypothetical protein